MTQLRVLSVIGTRPEAVKMAPIVQQLRQTPGVELLVCVTAQHREMLDQVLKLFDITPDVDLDLMQPDQSLAQITAAIFNRLDPVIKDLKPDWILTQGDTTTVMATALLAYYNRVNSGMSRRDCAPVTSSNPSPRRLIAASRGWPPTCTLRRPNGQDKTC